MKKLILLIIVIILSFTAFLYTYLSPKNYENNHKISDFEVSEKYNKKDKYYYFKFTKEEYEFDILLPENYRNKRELVQEIKELENDSEYCIYPIIKDIKTYPLCYKDNKLISYNLVDQELIKEIYNPDINSVEDTYKNINIYNYLNQNYLLWSYKGFYYLNEDTQKEIQLFNKDIYDVSLVASIDNYLLIPDYNEKYTFKKMYIVDFKTEEYSTWNLDYEIYFDSYVMGSFDKSVYIFDKKNKVQYELVPHKKKMRKIGSSSKMGKIYNKGWEDISYDKLATKNHTFTYFEKYSYKIENKKLYLYNSESDLKTQISAFENPKILFQVKDNVYYLTEDKLYVYNPFIGEVLLMQYFEWNFNNDNMIFIYLK